MPRYFFNVRYEGSGSDAVGEELPDNAAAWHEATIIAGDLFNIDGRFSPGNEWSVEVTDERRNPLYLLRVSAKEI